ncbi:sugar transferase [Sphingomonas lycopersici]|uniref:Sugar transferase n=1 Tax=Sphingomonas lycopersici TaxID=2951807 RepID=A0AA41ZK35_9SPHN|nr:sugar transferase [Sphingomonas lycopersici]MCW6537268.1 sugar transferase [Sphingomonas lycopersici]
MKDTVRSAATRLRFLLGGAFTLITLSHLMLAAMVPNDQWSHSIALTTSIGSGIATCFSVMLAREITRYPGVEASAYLLPSFFICYGVLLTAFLLTRIGYSRPLLIANFAATLAWCIGIVAVSNRRVLKIGIVPEGRFEPLLTAPLVSGILLDHVGDDHLRLDAVAADLQHDLSSHWERFLADCALRGLPVYHTKHLLESLTGKVELRHLSENNFGMLSPVSLFMTIKHTADWILALLMAIALLPVFALLALAIRMDSPGPVIFKQERVGYRGRIFTVYKFRTMFAVPAENASAREAAKTRDRDHRITRVGAFLRRTRLDELPQILNILKGDMSWIGPRPEARVLSEWYEAELPFYRYRHIVRPGLTGWAQVSQGHVAEIADVQEKLYFDFFYIKNFSFWIDIVIVARTIMIIITGFGAR